MQESTMVDFTGQRVCVGLDVSRNSWSVKIIGKEVDCKPFVQSPDPDALATHLRRYYPGADFLVGYEPGCTGFWTAHRLIELDIRCVVLNPADVPTSDKQRRQKTDARDCIKIADALLSERVQTIRIPSPTAVEDRQLIRTRAALVKQQTRVKNQIKALLLMYCLGVNAPVHERWSKAYIAWLQSLAVDRPSLRISLDAYLAELAHIRSSIAQLTWEIRKLSQTERYRSVTTLVKSVPGFGILGAMTIATEIEDIRAFGNVDHFASYIGLIPTTRSSGDTERVGSITPRSNRVLKAMIVEAAWVARRRDPELAEAFDVLSKRMKKTKAIIKIARKLASRVHHVLRTGEFYRFENAKYVNGQLPEAAPNQ